MHAELKSLVTFGVDLRHFEPEDATRFGFDAMAMIGPTDDDTSDAFHLVVCSPSWFAENFDAPIVAEHRPRAGSVRLGAGFLFMERWDHQALMDSVAEWCARFEAPDWGALASRIGRAIPWEYDYRYDDHIDAQLADHSIRPFPGTTT